MNNERDYCRKELARYAPQNNPSLPVSDADYHCGITCCRFVPFRLLKINLGVMSNHVLVGL
jgi:hypothetical protein